MQYLKHATGVLALVTGMAGAPAVLAAGTNAGDPVTNAVELSFQVNGVGQTANTDITFLVDRKLSLDVTTVDADWVTVVPGQPATSGAANAIRYTVSNTSNDDLDVVVALLDQQGTDVTGFDTNGGAPTVITSTTIVLWLDANNNGVIDGAEAAITPVAGVYNLGNLAEDATPVVAVIIDVDAGAAEGEYLAFSLVAAAANAGTALVGDDSGNAAPGGSSTNAADDIGLEQMVFADAGSANSEDEQYDFVNGAVVALADVGSNGQNSDTSGFITAVALAVAKYVEVIFDPITGNKYDGAGVAIAGANPKAIPGAVMMYVIGVLNNNIALSATTVAINDDIPATTVLAGDQANPATAIEVPAAVAFDVDGDAVDESITLDRANVNTDLDLVWDEDCGSATATSAAFAATDPELNAVSLGTCAATEDGYIVYFVTINSAI